MHGPPQDIFPNECVYTHDPTGLNVLKKGCAHYCNQTVLVSLGVGAYCPGAQGLPSGAEQAASLGEQGCTAEGLYLALQVGLGETAAWAVGVAGPPTHPPTCFVSHRNLAAAKGFLGLTVPSVPGDSPTPAMAKAT